MTLYLSKSDDKHVTVLKRCPVCEKDMGFCWVPEDLIKDVQPEYCTECKRQIRLARMVAEGKFPEI